MPTFDLDAKYILVALLFAALLVTKFVAGRRAVDRPLRRPRRFGFRGEFGPLRDPAAAAKAPPPPDPEEEFFGRDDSASGERAKESGEGTDRAP